MTSSNLYVDERRRTYVRLIGEIHHALGMALHEEYEQRGLTKAEIARILNKQKSEITRLFEGTRNMTLETFSDIAYALNRPVNISLPSRTNVPNTNHQQNQIQATTSPQAQATMSPQAQATTSPQPMERFEVEAPVAA